MNKTLAFIVVSLLIPRFAAAEIYKCNGKWTNRRCAGAPAEQFEEVPLDQKTTDPEFKAKREVVRSFRDYDYRARLLDVHIDELADLENLCLKTASTVNDCKELRDKLMEKYDLRIEMARERKERNELLERVQKAEADAKEAKEEVARLKEDVNRALREAELARRATEHPYVPRPQVIVVPQQRGQSPRKQD